MYQIYKSSDPLKKYEARFDDGKIVRFGAIRLNGEPYSQFQDRTPLKLYKAYDHNDTMRRQRYYVRHRKDYQEYSPDWFSKKYLW